MPRIVFFVIFALAAFFPAHVFSQTGHQYYISGFVCDSTANPIEGAVATLTTPAGVKVKGIFTDKQGRFRFEGIAPGRYDISIMHLTYKEYNIKVDLTGNRELGTIRMEHNVMAMDPIRILASRVEYSADSYTVSMQNNPIAKGKTASEALGLLPYLSSEDGKPRLFGQEVGRIRINGIVITDLAELEAIQAEDLESVKVVFFGKPGEPGSGDNGEIDIKLRRPPTGGFFGSVSGISTAYFNYGHTKDNLNSSFSYGNKKLSIYNYLNILRDNVFSDNEYSTLYRESDTHRHTMTGQRTPTIAFSDRLSVTYDIAKKQTLGLNLRYGINDRTPDFNSSTRIIHDSVTSLSGADNSGRRINRQYQASLRYTWQTDDKGSSLEVSGDYLLYHTDADWDYEYIFNIGRDDRYSSFARDNVDNTVDMYYVRAKYLHKFNKKTGLELSARYNNNRTHQLIDYRNLEAGEWVVNADRSDNYRLRGDNYVAYAELSSMVSEKLSYTLTTTFDHRRMSYNSIAAGKENRKTYGNLGVTASLMYFIDKKRGDVLRFSYNRFLVAMPYDAITPVVTYSGQYSYSKGNLDLDPNRVNVWLLTLSLRNKTNMVLRFAKGNNILYYKTFIDSQDSLVTYTMPVSDGAAVSRWFQIDHTFKLAGWWRLKIFGMIENSKKMASDFNFTSWFGMLNINNSIDFKKGWGGTAGFAWTSGAKLFNRNHGQDYRVDMSAYKYLFDRKLRITLSGVPYRVQRSTITDNDRIWSKTYPRTDQRHITLRATYNFRGGSRKIKVKQTASQQEYTEIKDE